MINCILSVFTCTLVSGCLPFYYNFIDWLIDWVNFGVGSGARHLCPKLMYEKWTKCPDCTFAEKLSKWSNYFFIFARKIFSRFFGWGACPPYPRLLRLHRRPLDHSNCIGSMDYIHHRHLLLLPSPKADTHFTIPRRVEGWVDLAGWARLARYPGGLEYISDARSDWKKTGPGKYKTWNMMDWIAELENAWMHLPFFQPWGIVILLSVIFWPYKFSSGAPLCKTPGEYSKHYQRIEETLSFANAWTLQCINNSLTHPT